MANNNKQRNKMSTCFFGQVIETISSLFSNFTFLAHFDKKANYEFITKEFFEGINRLME